MRFTGAMDAAGTKSYRLSCRKVFGDYGGNEQNQPESMRAFMFADPGKLIGQTDQRGAEAWIVANESERGRFIRLFEAGIKPHTYLALNLFCDNFRGNHSRDRYTFQEPEELVSFPEWKELKTKIEDSDREYALGKMICHAKNYDMKAPTFQLNVLQRTQGRIRLTRKEAQDFLRMFEKLFPEIIAWQEEVTSKVAADRILRNLFGYPRYFGGRWSPELIREALSFIPQSTVGCLTSIVATAFQEYIEAEKLDWDYLTNVHDAVVFQAPPEEIVTACRKCESLFAIPLTSSRGYTFKMGSDSGYGPTWAKKSHTKLK